MLTTVYDVPIYIRFKWRDLHGACLVLYRISCREGPFCRAIPNKQLGLTRSPRTHLSLSQAPKKNRIFQETQSCINGLFLICPVPIIWNAYSDAFSVRTKNDTRSKILNILFPELYREWTWVEALAVQCHSIRYCFIQNTLLTHKATRLQLAGRGAGTPLNA